MDQGLGFNFWYQEFPSAPILRRCMEVLLMDKISYTVPPVPKLMIPFPGTMNWIWVDTAEVEPDVAFINASCFVPPGLIG